ncbi:hypothetical protein SERLADRAFT_417641 [Serpula lacrymans var. lacrymans S7.9]|uniref:Wax synthase domain-containing protein n=1 Tax=Serpula lacrymans var. lacrymans (strain S7.9) TaxID=578457 RepID=F8P7A6_SERL9|nr:uncharacterized protein SERLADRAFT_417641 [Serpula lacrymans var. lacrymans S7.9]EGO21322.1 hypothetical protein SERLADRAFT_417641 [Serpula lacrymans var. lacrymans S7.9]
MSLSSAGHAFSDILRSKPKLPLTFQTFASHILPLLLCYYTTAVLVLLPRTQPIRIILLPITVLAVFRAVLITDQALDALKHLVIFLITVRTLEWTSQIEPYRRQAVRYSFNKEGLGTKAEAVPEYSNLFMNALDLVCSLRGVGWNWSRGLYIPPDTRPTGSKVRFLASTFMLFVWYTFICGTLHTAVKSFSPETIGSSSGGTTFDPSLAPLLRYTRSSIIATLTAFVIFNFMHCGYYFGAFVSIFFLGHDPSQWPPIFDKPWRATSLKEMWGRRWHQFFRQSFVFIGRWFGFVGGRAGVVMGAFLASGVYHHIATFAIDAEVDAWPTLVSFGMMGVGILLEAAFERVTRRRVGGWVGWLWTMAWMMLWGNLMVDAWTRAGMLGCSSFLDQVAPVKKAVQWTVEGFDKLLHQ